MNSNKKLIDADALERDGWRMSRIVQIDEKTMELQTRKPMDFPAVDAEPVRHGKWIRKTDTRFGEMLNDILICSECQIAFSTVKMIRRSYCPNCGARMDKE